MKIDVYCLCKNEIRLAPFFIDYWKALADDVNVYVYDGLSSDGTRELLADYDWIHIEDFEPDALDDFNHMNLKNMCWKKSIGSADFVMVCDFDETIFSYSVGELREEFKKMKNGGYTILLPLSFDMLSDSFPEYKEGKYLHELCGYGFNNYQYETKAIFFDPNKINGINYVAGAHAVFPSGDVKWYESNKLFLMHAKYIGLDYYKERIRNRVVSARNMAYNMDGEKRKTEKMFEDTFNEKMSLKFKWGDVENRLDEFYNIRCDWSAWRGWKRYNKKA